jgi:hypothetical protein
MFILLILNTLFCMGRHEGEYYHTNLYSFGNSEHIDFYIYGDIELKNINNHGNIEKTSDINNIEYYILKLYEPITFTKGFEHNETILSVILEEIQLIFCNNELKKRIDLNWGGHILIGRIYFSNDNDNNHYTPIIMYVEDVRING